jgi:predicted AAA+ superfamily ATPase
LDLRGIETGTSAEELPPAALADSCRTWIQLGGFPEYALEEARLGYVHRLLNEDVVLKATRFDVAPIAGVRRPNALEAVLDSLLRQSGKELSYKELPGKESEPTHRSWLRALLDSGLIWELPQLDRSEGRRTRGKPKIYSVDPALVAAKHPGAPPPPAGPWPAMVETAVATGLRRSARDTGAEFGWAGKSGRWEVDFVHLEDGRSTAVEVTVGPPEKKLERLERAMRSVHADRGLVVHDSFDRPYEDPDTGAIVLGLHDFLLALEERSLSRWTW